MVVGRVTWYTASVLATAVLVVLPAGSVPAAPTVLCAGRPATIVGTAGTDHIKGTPGPDVIAGLGGPDRIDGLGGDDLLCGGRGDDQLTSYDQGRDVLVGGAGDDFVGSFENPHARVRLGTGDDFASSQVGAEPGWLLDGGPGRDHLFLNLTLALHEAGPMPGSIDLREGRLDLDPAGHPVTGTVAAWEELDIPNSVRWDVRGTDADERFLFEGLLGVHIRAGGGEDEILGTPQPDTIDAGAGEDTVTAYAGDDVCRHAEHTRGCERVSP
jgi:Ca2+-binding RTX toxin-like protein